MAAEAELWGHCKTWLRREYDGRLKKVEPSGDNGFPDGIILIPCCAPIFAEFKSPRGGVSSTRQRQWADWLKKSGFNFMLVNEFEIFKLAIAAYVIAETEEL